MKKQAFTAILLSAFLLSVIVGTQLVELVEANFIFICPEIVINNDGSITPPTEEGTIIKRRGDTYYLTADTTSRSFTIKRSNIVFDGHGYTINGGINGFGYSNTGLRLDGVNNVTVKDVTVQDFWGHFIALIDCYNCILLRIKTQGSSSQPLILRRSYNNTITRSSVYDLTLAIDSHHNLVIGNQLEVLYTTGCNNTIYGNTVTKYFFPREGCDNLFYGNNFYHIKNINMQANRWDNGSVGNFWFDYSIKYPNATEIGDTGIGTTPHVIDANNIDHYPLMFSFVPLPIIPEFPSGSVLMSFFVATLLIIPVLFKKRRRRQS